MTNHEIEQEALSRALNPLGSVTNYPGIYKGFEAKGIPASEIKPRENVFTYQAWKALGRQVRRGEHGVKLLTFRPIRKTVTNPETGKEEEETYSQPWTATVFHFSQTDPVNRPTGLKR